MCHRGRAAIHGRVAERGMSVEERPFMAALRKKGDGRGAKAPLFYGAVHLRDVLLDRVHPLDQSNSASEKLRGECPCHTDCGLNAKIKFQVFRRARAFPEQSQRIACPT